MLTHQELQSSLPVLIGVRVTQSLIIYVVFCRSLFYLSSFFHVVIVLSVLRFSVSSYPFSSFQWCSCYLYSVLLIIVFFIWSLRCLSFYDCRVLVISLWYLQTFHNPVKFKTTYVCRINSQSDWCPTLFCSCIYLCPIRLKYNDKKNVDIIFSAHDVFLK